MIYSIEQQEALDKIKKFLASNDEYFLLAGYSGTGKTTLAKEIATEYKATILTPTNTALKRIKEKINNDKLTYSTLHSYLFKPTKDKNNKLYFKGMYKLNAKVYIIDECSMIDSYILNYIINNKSKQSKVIFLGDSYQLEPVGKNPEIFKWEESNPVFKEHNKALLTTVQRYSGEILRIATEIRTNKDMRFKYNKTPDFIIRNNFSKKIIDDFKNFQNSVVLCATNKKRVLYNKTIRKHLYKEQESNVINDHEILLCINNNDYFCNGDVFYVGNVHIFHEFTFELKGKNIKAALISHNNVTTLLLPELTDPSFSIRYFEDNYQLLNPIIRDKLLVYNTKYGEYKASKTIVVATYGYAISTHKAQGNEWDNVYVDAKELFFKDSSAKWLYTAITRAKSYVELLPNYKIKIIINN